MTLPRLLSYLIPLVIGGFIVYSFMPKGTQEKRDLEKQKKLTQEKIDSINYLIQHTKEREAYWVIVTKERKDSLNAALKKAADYKKKYEKPLTVIHYSEPELDSVISILTR